MRFLPFYQETLVLPFQQQETANRLRLATRPLEKDVEYAEELEQHFLFHGWVKDNRFRISRKVQQAENFLPLIIGQIEGTSGGSILFIQYRLFFGAVFFLVFWSVIAVLFFLFFLFINQSYLYASLVAFAGLFHYYIVTKNFHLQIRSSRQALEKALNREMPFPHAGE